jgi:hypothetical protein
VAERDAVEQRLLAMRTELARFVASSADVREQRLQEERASTLAELAKEREARAAGEAKLLTTKEVVRGIARRNATVVAELEEEHMSVLASEREKTAAAELRASQLAVQLAQRAVQTVEAQVHVAASGSSSGSIASVQKSSVSSAGSATEPSSADSWAERGGITVSVRGDSGRSWKVLLRREDTVYSVKEQLASKYGVNIRRQILTYKFKKLDDAATMSDCGVGDGAILKLGTDGSIQSIRYTKT